MAKRRDRIPPDVITFMHLPGLGPKTARRIWQELGITTVAELRAAAEQERLRTLTGLGPKVEENILKALKERTKPKAPARPLLGHGLPGGARGRRGAARASGRGAGLRGGLACAAAARPSATST